MAIHYIPNDPRCVDMAPLRTISPRPDRPKNQAGFTFRGPWPEATYPLDSPGFLHWQCREALLAATEAWEATLGQPLKRWHEGKRLEVVADDGVDLNAYYDRKSLRFFRLKHGDTTYCSGASADVVAHELGHACLDQIQPELWNAALLEAAAFHEGFGDCMAVLTALHDAETRRAVLPRLRGHNGVEGTMEALAEGIAAVEGATHNAAAPRHAHNDFQHALPETLPRFGGPDDGPGKLINESHSFGQILSGCFYDTLVNIYTARGDRGEADLLVSAQIAGRLLAWAARDAPRKPRYFREIGRAMVLADAEHHDGAYEAAIRDAFQAHGIALSLGAAFTPELAVGGLAPMMTTARRLAAALQDELMRRLGVGSASDVSVRQRWFGGQKICELVHCRPVALGGLHPLLKGVLAFAPETVLLGEARRSTVVLGPLPDALGTVREVEDHVRTLLERGAIALSRRPAVELLTRQLPPSVTHVISAVGGRKVLQRVRFACRCCPHRGLAAVAGEAR